MKNLKNRILFTVTFFLGLSTNSFSQASDKTKTDAFEMVRGELLSNQNKCYKYQYNEITYDINNGTFTVEYRNGDVVKTFLATLNIYSFKSAYEYGSGDCAKEPSCTYIELYANSGEVASTKNQEQRNYTRFLLKSDYYNDKWFKAAILLLIRIYQK